MPRGKKVGYAGRWEKNGADRCRVPWNAGADATKGAGRARQEGTSADVRDGGRDGSQVLLVSVAQDLYSCSEDSLDFGRRVQDGIVQK